MSQIVLQWGLKWTQQLVYYFPQNRLLHVVRTNLIGQSFNHSHRVQKIPSHYAMN